MKDKNIIRYIGFRSADDGGRVFDFSVSATEHGDVLTSIEIPNELFAGAGRIRLQEGVGISYAKLKRLLEISALTELPRQLSLTAADVAQYREVLPTGLKRTSVSGADSDRMRSGTGGL